MKINEVEQLTGITKKNIRFYEEQGLLSPGRNAENGYRVYGDWEIRALKQIKMMRKLGVPIEDIRKMQNGTYTVADGMRRHLITLEREKQNLEHSAVLCREMKDRNVFLSEVDADPILKKMDEMERSGASFQNKQNEDVRTRYVAPVVAAIFWIGLMFGFILLMTRDYAVATEDVSAVTSVPIVLCSGLSIGILIALFQRIREIEKGEEDDARQY